MAKVTDIILNENEKVITYMCIETDYSLEEIDYDIHLSNEFIENAKKEYNGNIKEAIKNNIESSFDDGVISDAIRNEIDNITKNF